jgi:hypothetical protein
MVQAVRRFGKSMTGDDIIIIGVVIKELEKEGVGYVQAHRIGEAVAAAIGALHAANTTTDRHI